MMTYFFRYTLIATLAVSTASANEVPSQPLCSENVSTNCIMPVDPEHSLLWEYYTRDADGVQSRCFQEMQVVDIPNVGRRNFMTGFKIHNSLDCPKYINRAATCGAGRTSRRNFWDIDNPGDEYDSASFRHDAHCPFHIFQVAHGGTHRADPGYDYYFNSLDSLGNRQLRSHLRAHRYETSAEQLYLRELAPTYHRGANAFITKGDGEEYRLQDFEHLYLDFNFGIPRGKNIEPNCQAIEGERDAHISVPKSRSKLSFLYEYLDDLGRVVVQNALIINLSAEEGYTPKSFPDAHVSNWSCRPHPIWGNYNCTLHLKPSVLDATAVDSTLTRYRVDILQLLRRYSKKLPSPDATQSYLPHPPDMGWRNARIKNLQWNNTVTCASKETILSGHNLYADLREPIEESAELALRFVEVAPESSTGLLPLALRVRNGGTVDARSTVVALQLPSSQYSIHEVATPDWFCKQYGNEVRCLAPEPGLTSNNSSYLSLALQSAHTVNTPQRFIASVSSQVYERNFENNRDEITIP